MEMLELKTELLNKRNNGNLLFKKKLVEPNQIEIYSHSIIEKDGTVFFIGREGSNKFLFTLFDDQNKLTASHFEGYTSKVENSDNLYIKKCELNTLNRKSIQILFDFTNPQIIGLKNSFGFGDRIGFANAAHIRSLNKSNFLPVLAQQSIRELTRTKRTPAEVMDAAIWAVFQEGYLNGFSADADHLKTTQDIDLMVENGFKMFTFDPGEYVHNEADSLTGKELEDAIKSINWPGLQTDYQNLEKEYLTRVFQISSELGISADKNKIKQAVVKYGDAIAHIKLMYDHLKIMHKDYESEVEISVDETESVTTPFEHFFIVNELKRLGVNLISLAPRFVGSFEKGIDYKGDLILFKQEYLKHLQISKYFGNYKISLHSGSDKFSIYKVIGEINDGCIHVKTAGTSYLEALKVAAIKQTKLFREIFDYSLSLYETEKKSYHVSADIAKLKNSNEYSNEELLELFNNDDFRQILHVTFGRVLTDKSSDGDFIFKQRLIDCLKQNEETHYEVIINHFKKHLEPFKQE